MRSEVEAEGTRGRKKQQQLKWWPPREKTQKQRKVKSSRLALSPVSALTQTYENSLKRGWASKLQLCSSSSHPCNSLRPPRACECRYGHRQDGGVFGSGYPPFTLVPTSNSALRWYFRAGSCANARAVFAGS